jgi:hypothetical protein
MRDPREVLPGTIVMNEDGTMLFSSLALRPDGKPLVQSTWWQSLVAAGRAEAERLGIPFEMLVARNEALAKGLI